MTLPTGEKLDILLINRAGINLRSLSLGVMYSGVPWIADKVGKKRHLTGEAIASRDFTTKFTMEYF